MPNYAIKCIQSHLLAYHLGYYHRFNCIYPKSTLYRVVIRWQVIAFGFRNPYRIENLSRCHILSNWSSVCQFNYLNLNIKSKSTLYRVVIRWQVIEFGFRNPYHIVYMSRCHISSNWSSACQYMLSTWTCFVRFYTRSILSLYRVVIRWQVIAFGFRNPYRIEFRPGTTELWIGDVGFGYYPATIMWQILSGSR